MSSPTGRRGCQAISTSILVEETQPERRGPLPITDSLAFGFANLQNESFDNMAGIRELTGVFNRFPEHGGPRHLMHFGTAFKPAPRHQLNLHVGVGLSSAAVDHCIGVGYSFSFQARR